MFPIINSVYHGIREDKELSSLKKLSSLKEKNSGELSCLNSIVVYGLPKSTTIKKIFEIGNRVIIKYNLAHSKSHSEKKELIAELLGGDIYHAAKVQSYISAAVLDFARLKNRCDKIRSLEVLLGVFIEIMHKYRNTSLLTDEQLEELLSSFPGLSSMVNKGVRACPKDKPMQFLEARLLVLQVMYDHLSKNNITDDKLQKMDKDKKEELFSFISGGIIQSCLKKRSAFETSFLKENGLKEKVFQSVKEDLYKIQSIA